KSWACKCFSPSTSAPSPTPKPSTSRVQTGQSRAKRSTPPRRGRHTAYSSFPNSVWERIAWKLRFPYSENLLALSVFWHGLLWPGLPPLLWHGLRPCHRDGRRSPSKPTPVKLHQETRPPERRGRQTTPQRVG